MRLRGLSLHWDACFCLFTYTHPRTNGIYRGAPVPPRSFSPNGICQICPGRYLVSSTSFLTSVKVYQIALVTGGNTGIGYHTVKQLLLKNAKVYLAARSPDKAAAAIKRLEEETKGKKAIFLKLDLADLSRVRKAAEGFLALESRLDLLFNNGYVNSQRWTISLRDAD